MSAETGYIQDGTWNGMPLYRTTFDTYATVDLDAMLQYVYNHGFGPGSEPVVSSIIIPVDSETIDLTASGHHVSANLKPGIAGGAVSSVAGKTGNVTLTKEDVGLSNVPNVDIIELVTAPNTSPPTPTLQDLLKAYDPDATAAKITFVVNGSDVVHTINLVEGLTYALSVEATNG